MIAAPKIGLKHPKNVSKISEFLPGTHFHPIYHNTVGVSHDVTKVVFCSGKVYFDMQDKLHKQTPEGKVLVIRLEELAPFPSKHIEAALASVPQGAEVYYC